jgi:hypothetical protein
MQTTNLSPCILFNFYFFLRIFRQQMTPTNIVVKSESDLPKCKFNANFARNSWIPPTITNTPINTTRFNNQFLVYLPRFVQSCRKYDLVLIFSLQEDNDLLTCNRFTIEFGLQQFILRSSYHKDSLYKYCRAIAFRFRRFIDD